MFEGERFGRHNVVAVEATTAARVAHADRRTGGSAPRTPGPRPARIGRRCVNSLRGRALAGRAGEGDGLAPAAPAPAFIAAAACAAAPVALATGASRASAREIARQLLGAGLGVLVGARDAERGRSAAE